MKSGIQDAQDGSSGIKIMQLLSFCPGFAGQKESVRSAVRIGLLPFLRCDTFLLYFESVFSLSSRDCVG